MIGIGNKNINIYRDFIKLKKWFNVVESETVLEKYKHMLILTYV